MVQRPLSLDWARFLGIMGLCLEGAIKGTGTVASSAVARLFEEIHDDKLDFLTRKRSRLPPARKSPHGTGGGGEWSHDGDGGRNGARGSCVRLKSVTRITFLAGVKAHRPSLRKLWLVTTSVSACRLQPQHNFEYRRRYEGE